MPPHLQGLRKTRVQPICTNPSSLSGSDSCYPTITPKDGSESQPLPFTHEKDIQSPDVTSSGSHKSSPHPFSNHRIPFGALSTALPGPLSSLRTPAYFKCLRHLPKQQSRTGTSPTGSQGSCPVPPWEQGSQLPQFAGF